MEGAMRKLSRDETAFAVDVETGELVQVRSYLDERGREMVSSVKVAPPVGWKEPPSLIQMIRDMVRSERFAEEQRREGFETFEEADDFDIEDDPIDPQTPYERVFDPGDVQPPAPVEVVEKWGAGAAPPPPGSPSDGAGAAFSSPGDRPGGPLLPPGGSLDKA